MTGQDEEVFLMLSQNSRLRAMKSLLYSYYTDFDFLPYTWE